MLIIDQYYLSVLTCHVAVTNGLLNVILLYAVTATYGTVGTFILSTEVECIYYKFRIVFLRLFTIDQYYLSVLTRHATVTNSLLNVILWCAVTATYGTVGTFFLSTRLECI